MGCTPEDGPFFKALNAESLKGAVMILDEQVAPFERIWCLFEVYVIGKLKHRLALLTEHGDITDITDVAGDVAGTTTHDIGGNPGSGGDVAASACTAAGLSIGFSERRTRPAV